MRAFIGIPFDKDVADYLEKSKLELLKQTTKANPTRKENFHLTLLFLGDIDEFHQNKIEKVLDQVTFISRFNLILGNIGTFNKGKDSIAWMGIHDGIESLHTLQQTIVQLINDLGYHFPFDYQPHITLMRNAIFNENINNMKVDSYLNPITVHQIHLYESHHVNGILTYTPRKTIILK